MTHSEINTEAQRLAHVDVNELQPSKQYGPMHFSKHVWAMAELHASVVGCTPAEAITRLVELKLRARCAKALAEGYRNVLSSSPAARLAVAYASTPSDELASSPGVEA